MKNLHITTIQTDLHWENPAANLAHFEELLLAIPAGEIVVLPEMFTTGFSMQPTLFAEPMDGTTVLWMQKMAAVKNIILIGSIMIVDESKYYNRLLWVLPNGQISFYDKRHLFAHGNEHLHYTPGHKKLIAQVNGWKIQLLICYDLRFPVWSRQQLVPQIHGNLSPVFDLIIYVANWPEKRGAAWCTLLQARAIENQCFVVGVNRIGKDNNEIYHRGDSMVIDPLGAILYQKTDEASVANHVLDGKFLEDIRLRLPFWKDGDAFQFIDTSL